MHDHRSRSPVKKSRALSTPPEVDENDNDEEEYVDALEHDIPTLSPHPSPPHETKIRQLSQTTDDINRRDDQSPPQDSADTVPAPVTPDSATTDAQAQIGTSLETAATIPELQNQPDVVEFSAPENVAVKTQIKQTGGTASVEHAAAPPPAGIPAPTQEAEVPATTSAIPVPQSEAQCTHKIDNQTSSALPAEARADSNPWETKCPTPSSSEADSATKRPREDEDGDLDPNPREAKRASPPPEVEKDKEKKERPARKKSGSDAHAQSTPASPRSKPASTFVGCLDLDLFYSCMLICPQGGGGFLAYASVSSPFSAIKGPGLFGSSSTLTKSSTIVTATTTTTPTTANAVPALTTTPTLPNSPPKTAPSSPVLRNVSPTPAKRTGFEAFASAASPFASAATRTRSPVRRSGSPGPGSGARSNPFAVYATGGAQGLFGASGAPAAKRARGDSESIAPGEGNENSSWREGSAGAEKTFGERLRAGSGSGGDEDDEADGGFGVWGEQATSGKWTEQEGECNFVVCMLESVLIIVSSFNLFSADGRRRGRDDPQRAGKVVCA